MADKIGGGGGYLDSFKNAAEGLIDGAADAVSDAAQTTADVVKSGAEGIKEGAKELVADAAALGEEALEVGEGGYDRLKKMGATADRKIEDLKGEVSSGVERAMKSLSEPLQLATNPELVSEKLQEFFEAPFVTYIESNLDPMVLGKDACERIVALGGDIADNTIRLIDEYPIDEVVSEVVDVLNRLEDLQLSDIGVSVDGTKSFLREALGDAVELAEKATAFEDTFDEVGQAGDQLLEFRSDFLSPLMVNPLVGAPVNAATFVLGSVLRGVGDIDDVSRSIIDNQDAVEEMIEAMDPNYIANKASVLEVGGEVTLRGTVEGKAYAELGGEGEAGAEITVKKTSKEPDVYEVSFGLNAKVGGGLGAATNDAGVELSVDASAGGKVTLEVKGEDLSRMSQTLFASGFINSDSIADSLGEFDFKVVGIETASGVGLSADAEAVVAGLKGEVGLTETNLTSFDSSGNELAGKKYSFQSKAELNVGDVKLGVTLTDEMAIGHLEESMGSVPLFGSASMAPVLEAVVDVVGADAMLKVSGSVEGSIEYLEPVGVNGDDVYKINVKHNLAFNEGGVETSAFIEIKGVGALVKKDPDLATLMKGVALGERSVEELEARIQANGVDPKSVVTARVQVDFNRTDGVSVKTPFMKVEALEKAPPMTLVSFTAIGDDSKDVALSTTVGRFKSRFEEVSAEVRAEAKKSRPKMKAMSAWSMTSQIRQ